MVIVAMMVADTPTVLLRVIRVMDIRQTVGRTSSANTDTATAGASIALVDTRRNPGQAPINSAFSELGCFLGLATPNRTSYGGGVLRIRTLPVP